MCLAGSPEVVRGGFTCPAEVYVQKEARQRTPLPRTYPAGTSCVILHIVFSYLLYVFRSKYNLQGLPFPFCHVEPWNQTQVVRLGGPKCLQPMRHLARSVYLFIIIILISVCGRYLCLHVCCMYLYVHVCARMCKGQGD